MNLDELLLHLDAVRLRGAGRWSARCPAHADRVPSLSVREGERGILLTCFAGCSLDEICASLGIRGRDLFYDADPHPRNRRQARRETRPWRFDWRQVSASLLFHAETRWLRGEAVLTAAHGLDTAIWRDQDREAAMASVSKAYTDLERADLLEFVAFNLRLRGIANESRRAAA